MYYSTQEEKVAGERFEKSDVLFTPFVKLLTSPEVVVLVACLSVLWELASHHVLLGRVTV